MVLALMSVSGTGKTTIGKALVADLGWAFVEGDDFHPSRTSRRRAPGSL